MTEPLSSPSEHERALEREKVARETHAWVRLTQRCNNRCVFCLDAHSDATTVSDESIIEQIRLGRSNGATKLILSGGEATTHPRFIDFVRIGRRLGYPKVQVITNGRMLSYPTFLERAIAAGLSEITVSIHGHTSELHDRLVGVSGAFDQAMTAICNSVGRVIVNVDVCLNRENVSHLPELLDRLIALGVQEFDLLHLAPFGRAFDNLALLAYDVAEAMPAISYALSLSRRPELHIWFNRFPSAYLEGFEHLIQDPWKLHDEVRGREAEMRRFAETGQPLRCFDSKRCSSCYMAGYCAALARVRDWLLSGNALLRITPPKSWQGDAYPNNFSGSWVRAPGVEQLQSIANQLVGDDVWLELESTEGLVFDPNGRYAGKRVRRVYVSGVDDLKRVTTLAGDFEIAVVLNRETVALLVARLEFPWSRVVLVAKTHLSRADADAASIDFRSALDALPASVPVEGLPHCLTLRPPLDQPPVLDLQSLGQSGSLDPHAFVQQYIADFAHLKSLRCANCAAASQCRGAHINLIRSQGFRVLEPLAARTLPPQSNP